MALIKSQLVLTDGMTAPLRSINKAINIVINSFESMQNISGRDIDTSSLQEAREEIAKASAALDQLDNKANKSTDALSKLAKAAGLIAVARKALDTVKTGIEYASDLAEVQNVVDVTFGNSADIINSWSKDCLTAYGMNEVSAKRYVGAMGAMLKSSGLVGVSVTQMSKDMVGLAGDMASFYNLDLDTAFEKIRSGISGETEPLKQLGINMSVANLEAYALSQGITTAYSEMSQAQQVMLRYNYLMSLTADAQGDFARTQDSYANQTRLLSESWLEFTGVLADKLLPVLTVVVSALNSVVAFLTDHADAVSSLLLGLAVTVGILAAAWAVHAASQWLAVEANRALVASLLTNPILWIAVCIGILIAIIYRWIQSVGGIKNAWDICKLAVIAGWNAVKSAFFKGVYWVMDLVDKLKLCWQKANAAITGFMGNMRVSVLNILQGMVNSAVDIINKFIALLNKLPGVSIEAVGHVTFAAAASAENEAAKSARAADLAAYEKELSDNKAARSSKIESIQSEYNSSVNALKSAYAQAKTEAADSSAEHTVLDSSAGLESLDRINADTSDINDSASGAADSLKETTEDFKYLRDIAERETINRFTTAEIKVDMSGMSNRIDSNMDIDGIISYLTDGVAEALVTASEGVY